MALVIRKNTVTTKSPPSKPDVNTSIVDAAWEIVDPNPDIHALFIHFNDTFFDGTLAGCEVRWSPRMTYCAGLCVYEGRGGLCSIRLSEPLLKFRPRKDLVETLLHEMIHAYLFVTVRDRDRDGHGPQFQSHMHRINAATGAKITIYHNFNDEVAFHRQHWWRCRGPCRERPPFYGYVKRASNRAPGPNDRWHNEHKLTCGGEFEKIKEPEGYSAKKSSKNGATAGTSTQGASNVKNDPSSTASKVKKATADDRFPGDGHVVGEPSGGKMRRLEDYFQPAAKVTTSKPKDVKDTQSDQPTTSNAAESDASTAKDNIESRFSCPVCQANIPSPDMNDHLDECLTQSMLQEEAGPSF